MELIKYLDVIRKWIWLIVLATVLAGGSGFIASSLAVPVYRTSTTLIVGQVINNPNPSPGDFATGEQLALTYVQLVTREPILAATINTLGLQQDWRSLRNQVAAVPISGTQLLEISVLDTSPERAKAIADEIARQMILQSPTTQSAADQDRLDFVRSQLPELESRIQDGQERINQLDKVIAGATSARQIQEAQQQQSVLQTQINQLQTTHAAMLASLQQGSVNYISVVDPAGLAGEPVSPNTPLNTLLAIVIGLSLSVGAAFVLDNLDDSVRSPEEVQALVGVPPLAAIPKFGSGSYTEMLITQSEPRSPITESYRSLRTNLQFLSVDKPVRIILITSSNPGEGKSVAAANLSVVFANAGKSVLLVDADLRKPVAHRIFQLNNHVGLTTWLMGQTRDPNENGAYDDASIESCAQSTPIAKLRVVCSGPLPPNPAEILGSNRMREFLDEAAKKADVIIIDSPPCVTVTDAVVLSQWVDGVLLVLDGQRTHRQTVARARETLEGAGARLLGAVLNRFDARESGYYYGYSNYQYYYSSEESGDSKPNGKGGQTRTRSNREKEGSIWSRLFGRSGSSKKVKAERPSRVSE